MHAHVLSLGRALWHALARTDAGTCAPQLCCCTSKQERTPAVLHLLGRQVTSGARDTDRDRERLGESTSSERGEGGDWREEEERFVQSRRELVTAVGDNRQETHHADIYTVVFKNKRTAFSYPALHLPILLPCAPHLPPLSVNLGALPCVYHLRSPAPPSLEALLLEHEMMGDMCAALANLRYALLPPDRLW